MIKKCILLKWRIFCYLSALNKMGTYRPLTQPAKHHFAAHISKIKTKIARSDD
jgi:hypothetical protein